MIRLDRPFSPQSPKLKSKNELVQIVPEVNEQAIQPSRYETKRNKKKSIQTIALSPKSFDSSLPSIDGH
jgi:hypothetical protein